MIQLTTLQLLNEATAFVQPPVEYMTLPRMVATLLANASNRSNMSAAASKKYHKHSFFALTLLKSIRPPTPAHYM